MPLVQHKLTHNVELQERKNTECCTQRATQGIETQGIETRGALAPSTPPFYSKNAKNTRSSEWSQPHTILHYSLHACLRLHRGKATPAAAVPPLHQCSTHACILIMQLSPLPQTLQLANGASRRSGAVRCIPCSPSTCRGCCALRAFWAPQIHQWQPFPFASQARSRSPAPAHNLNTPHCCVARKTGKAFHTGATCLHAEVG